MPSVQTTIEMLRADLNSRPASPESTLRADNTDVNWEGVAHVLRELRTEFVAAASDAEMLIKEHPFVLAAASLVVGLVAGRILGMYR